MLNEIYRRMAEIINSPQFLKHVIYNRFYLILLVIVLSRFKYATYNSMWLCALINIPGTILHETMHFLVGLFLNAQPVNYTIWPKKSMSGGYVMGSVGFRNICFYNAFPAAMAPLLLLPLGYYFDEIVLPMMPANIWSYILYVFVQTTIIENAVPSDADFRIARTSWLGMLFYVALMIWGFLYIIGIKHYL